MRIAIALPDKVAFASVRYLARELSDTLAASHDLRFLPPHWSVQGGRADESAIASELRDCDVLVGFHSTLRSLLTLRHERQIATPCLLFVLGALPRGAVLLRDIVPLLTTRDMLVVNCAADADLAARCFPSARVTLLPFAYDEDTYFAATLDERAALRSALDFTDDSRVLLYAGRMGLEKNVHTTIRVFAAVRRCFPEAVLLLAGPSHDAPFIEMGVPSVDYVRLLRGLTNWLDVPAGSVRYLGDVSPADLCALYNVCDAVVTMTLHHDENFGLAQVEAGACGTPVIGTAWGGLRDTIREGTNGFHVSTSATPLGVKVNWWEAINKTVALLRPLSFRDRSDREVIRGASTRYSRLQYRNSLHDLLRHVLSTPSDCSAPLTCSAFMSEYWATCLGADATHVRYHHASPSFELYRTLITSYTKATAASIASEERIAPADVLVLSSPVLRLADGRYGIGDLLFPSEIDLPTSLRACGGTVLDLMTAQPAITVADVRSQCERHDTEVNAVLAWLLAQGVLLRSRPESWWQLPSEADARFGHEYPTAERTGLSIAHGRR